jgi:hypothetical protein
MTKEPPHVHSNAKVRQDDGVVTRESPDTRCPVNQDIEERIASAQHVYRGHRKI